MTLCVKHLRSPIRRPSQVAMPRSRGRNPLPLRFPPPGCFFPAWATYLGFSFEWAWHSVTEGGGGIEVMMNSKTNVPRCVCTHFFFLRATKYASSRSSWLIGLKCQPPEPRTDPIVCCARVHNVVCASLKSRSAVSVRLRLVRCRAAAQNRVDLRVSVWRACSRAVRLLACLLVKESIAPLYEFAHAMHCSDYNLHYSHRSHGNYGRQHESRY